MSHHFIYLRAIDTIKLNYESSILILQGLAPRHCYQRSLLAMGDFDGNVQILDLNRANCRYSLLAHSHTVTTIAKLNDYTFITGGMDGLLKFWQLYSEHCRQTFRAHTGPISAAINLGPNKIASCGYDGTIKIWDIEHGQCVQTLEGHNDYVFAIKALPNNQLVSAGANSDPAIRIWDLTSGKCEHVLSVGSDLFTKSFVVTEKGHLVSCSQGSLRFWDTNTYRCIKVVPEIPNAALTMALVSNDIIAVGTDHQVALFNAYGELQTSVFGHQNYVSGIVPIHDQSFLSVGHDGNVISYQVPQAFSYPKQLHKSYSIPCFNDLTDPEQQEHSFNL